MKWVRQALIVLVLIALTASAFWTYISIRSMQTELPVNEVSLEVIPDYQIISRKALKLWPSGTVFEQGRVAYFYAAQPEVIVTPTVKINGLEQGTINGSLQSQIILQAVDDKSQAYWSYQLWETPVQKFTFSKEVQESDSENVFIGSNIALDAPAANALVDQIGEELTFQTGVFQLVVISQIKISGSVNSILVEKDIAQELPLNLQQVNFSVPRTQDITTKVSLTSNNNAAVSDQSLKEVLQSKIIPIAVMGALGLILLLLFAWENSTKSKAAKQHRRFKEWITEGSIDIKDRFSIHIHTLEGLVDLAIDLDKRVIYDSKVKKYYVLTEDIVYIHDYERSNSIIDNKLQLGKLLLERGLLLPEQLETGLYYQQKIGSRLGESLIALGFIEETTLYSTLASQHQIDYFELDPKMEIKDLTWLEKMTIIKARTLSALPLGLRADGKLVIACSEPSREGIHVALQEMFGSDIYLVASKPSAIYEVLELIDEREKKKTDYQNMTCETRLTPFERLTEKEREQFLAAYYRGSIIHELFLKASGLADPALFIQAPEQEPMISWLISKNIIHGEIANLMKGFETIIKAMEFKARQEKMLPTLLDLLASANYLTGETVEWCKREVILQGVTIDRLLINNYLSSADTIRYVNIFINTLQSILK